jgi:hypothetical protein
MRHKPAFAAAGVLSASFVLAGTAQPPTTARDRGGAKAGRLEPWEPVDPAFSGCSEGVCGGATATLKRSLSPAPRSGRPCTARSAAPCSR